MWLRSTGRQCSPWRARMPAPPESLDRMEFLAGNAFDVDFGGPYDAVLLTNFLHHFDEPTCVTLLKKIRAALKPGGITAVLEFVPNDDRVTPPEAARFSMMMLGTTAAGDAYTYRDSSACTWRRGSRDSRPSRCRQGRSRSWSDCPERLTR